jgi:glucose/arabinose dehydrogenase
LCWRKYFYGGGRQKRKIQQENVASLINSLLLPVNHHHYSNHFMKSLFSALLLASSSSFLSAQADIASQATDPAALTVADGFKVELLYSVPKAEQGSWVTMTIDDKGRIIASDQYGALYRVTVPAPGQQGEVAVEKIDLDIGHAQGTLYAFDSLYVVVNGKVNKGRGLYRVLDTDKDDKFDKVELLKKFTDVGGEHGPHAVILGPKKKSIYVVVGNQTPLVDYKNTLVPPFWGEDQLLPRVYGRGFMRGVEAPRGWIAKTDPDGKSWEIMATGFRNQYDAAFNHHGELFTYDADMEWDVNTPWYRPTRVNHVVSGGEYGWRNGSGKFPEYYEDNLPATINIGPGSPTGVCFGYGAAFPEKYQKAFFISDWSYGKMYAVHLEPDGASYKATFEEFVAGQPLPLTDQEIHPEHKCMYFLIGGRRTQGGLYRVTYVGKDCTTEANLDKDGITARTIRKSLEKYHGNKDPKAVNAAWSHLGSSDRYIRYAARTAIEHQPVQEWREKALVEKDTQTALSALLALARVGKTNDQDGILESLGNIKWSKLTTEQNLQVLRTYTLSFTRLGEPDKETRVGLGKSLAANLPDKNAHVNQELVQLLVYLQSSDVAKKAIALLESAPTQEEQIHYVKSLRWLGCGNKGSLLRMVW